MHTPNHRPGLAKLQPRRNVSTACVKCLSNPCIPRNLLSCSNGVQVKGNCNSRSDHGGDNATTSGSWPTSYELDSTTVQYHNPWVHAFAGFRGPSSSSSSSSSSWQPTQRPRSQTAARATQDQWEERQAESLVMLSSRKSQSTKQQGSSSPGRPPQALPTWDEEQLEPQQQQQRELPDGPATNPNDSDRNVAPSEAAADSTEDTSSSSGSSEGPAVRAALAMLQFYRSGISPMLQSTCRFLPTCSQYSIDSYKAYGVWKGTVLTAWRLMRCNPWGSSGYDPTTWPPPGLGWLFQYSYSAELAVVVGTATFLRLGHALLFE